MASLALERDDRPTSNSAARGTAELINSRAVTAELEQLAAEHGSGSPDLRAMVARRLKAALIEGRAKAEQMLLKDRHGTALRRTALSHAG